MTRILQFAAALLIAASFSVDCQAQEDDAKETATYGVSVGISPFGPSLGFSHNLSEKTTVQVGIGAFSGDNPADQEIQVKY